MPSIREGGKLMRLAVAALALLAGVVGALIVSGTSAASSPPSTITGGQTLTTGQSLDSADGHYELIMQGDGNLVEYITGGRFVWESRTNGNPGAYAVLERDGDLVVDTAGGETLWSDNAPASGCAALNVLDDGNVEVDGPSSVAWSTGGVTTMLEGDELMPGQAIFSPNEDYELIMQGDGNLVLYNTAGTALWESETNGHPGAYAVMQSDGNLVVYSNPTNGTALWDSGTGGNPGASLWVQSDGNLVVYAANSGPAKWQSHTDGSAAGSGHIQPVPQYGSASACPAPATTTTATPAPTVTVTVPTSTVLTVAPPASTGTKRHLKVGMKFFWSWTGSRSYLTRITFGKLPAGLHWVATITRRTRTLASSDRAATARQRHALLLWLERHSYSSGETVKVTLSRTGYVAETVTFRVRLHRLPDVIAPKLVKQKTVTKRR